MKNRLKFWIVIGGIGLLAGVLGASSQNHRTVHVDRPVVPARAEDVSTIEGIVKASLRDDFRRGWRSAAVGKGPNTL